MKKILAVISAMVLAVSTLTSFQIASAAEVTIDGKASEWKGVEMQTSTNTNIEKWAVMQDDKYVYFYVQTFPMQAVKEGVIPRFALLIC